MGKIVKNKIEYGGASSGASLPTGGTTGQALVKKSNTDGDVEWGTVEGVIGSGWGVAKTGIVRINFSGNDGTNTTVDLTDLNLASVDDYNVALIQCGGDGAWGHTKIYCSKATPTQLSIGAYKSESSSSYVDISYTIVAKGYGVLGDFDLPTDGDVGQLLAKGDASSNAMVWKDDMGVYLSQYGSKFGIQPAQFSITQVDGEYIEKTGNYYKYKLPRKGVLANVSRTADFDALINSSFDLYVKINGYSYYSHAEYKGQLFTSDLYWRLTGTDIALDLSISVDGDNLIFSGSGYEYAFPVSQRYSLDAVRLVAKSGYNFGLTNGTEPYIIRNLTGMVLNDLRVTGNAVPTDWGVATVAKTSMSMSAGNASTQTIDISGFGFESADDYTVLCNIYSGAGDWAKATMNVGTKTASSFLLIAKPVASNVTRVDIEYTIFAKGYGNNTMQDGGSGNSGATNIYSTQEIEVGTWINGKKIYQKTVLCVMPSNVVDGTVSSTYEPHGVTNIEQIIGHESVSKATTGEVGGEPGSFTVPANGAILFTNIQVDSYQVNLSTNISTYSDKEYYVTFRYTKV